MVPRVRAGTPRHRTAGRARDNLRALDADAAAQPDYVGVLQSQALAYAGIGDLEAARASAMRVLDLIPADVDLYVGPSVAQDAAIALARAGDRERAMAVLESIAPLPYITKLTTPRLLRTHPRWDDLRDHPRFGALVAAADPLVADPADRR